MTTLNNFRACLIALEFNFAWWDALACHLQNQRVKPYFHLLNWWKLSSFITEPHISPYSFLLIYLSYSKFIIIKSVLQPFPAILYILTSLHYLAKFPFITSEMEVDYHLQKGNVRVISSDAKWLKTQDLRKLVNFQKTNKLPLEN